MPSNQKQMIEQAKFTYSLLGNDLEKQIKTIEDHRKKQVKAIKEHGKQLISQKYNVPFTKKDKIFNS